MTIDSCFLTTKDFTILEVMRERRLGQSDPLMPILERKLNAARLVFREDVPPGVATLSSRVRFSVDGRDPDVRVLSHDRMSLPIGMFLPITTKRGLALLGLVEGAVFALSGDDDGDRLVRLEAVEYQPESALRERDRAAAAERSRPVLRLIRGALDGTPGRAAAGRRGVDDPGPSVA